MRKLLLVGAALAAATTAQANVAVHVERSPARQAQLQPNAAAEDFSGVSGTAFSSAFGGSANAVFSGFAAASGAATLGAGTATIKFDRGIRYFGYRPSALDENNTIELFSKGASLGYYNFVDSPVKTGIVGASLAWGIANMMSGTSGTAPYNYINFFSDAPIDEVRFTQVAGTFSLDDVRIADVEPLAVKPASLAQVSAVPESGTWALMILGFGTVGFALRRRHRAKGVRFA